MDGVVIAVVCCVTVAFGCILQAGDILRCLLRDTRAEDLPALGRAAAAEIHELGMCAVLWQFAALSALVFRLAELDGLPGLVTASAWSFNICIALAFWLRHGRHSRWVIGRNPVGKRP